MSYPKTDIYIYQVTFNNIFKDFSNIQPAYKDALRIYSNEIYYSIINRYLRLSAVDRITANIKKRYTKNPVQSGPFTDTIPYDEYKKLEVVALGALKKILEIFKEDITRHVFPMKITVYRSIYNKYRHLFTSELYTVYEDKALTSSSISLDFVLGFKRISGFKTKLHLLPGLTYNVVPLGNNNISVLSGEKEVLIKNGAVYFYIGKHDIVNKEEWSGHSLTEVPVTLFEFILLPNIATYEKIGKDKLIEMGKEIFKETVDILESVKLLEEHLESVKLPPSYNYPLIHVPQIKNTYMDELSYLIQQFITKDILNSKSFYTDFGENVKKLQQIQFLHHDLEPIHKYFPDKDYFIERQISYIKWFIYLIDNKLLTPNNEYLINNIELLKHQSDMRAGLFKHLRALTEYKDAYHQNRGGGLTPRRILKN